jgi:hypothetical protein
MTLNKKSGGFKSQLAKNKKELEQSAKRHITSLSAMRAHPHE